MATASGWAGLFMSAFRRSRNAMVLLDEQRRDVEVNPAFLGLLGQRRGDVMGHQAWEFVVDGPATTPGEWHTMLNQDDFSGVVDMVHTDGSVVTVQWAGHPEQATGKRLPLIVALPPRRGGRGLRSAEPTGVPLSDREREVVELIGRGNSGPEI